MQPKSALMARLLLNRYFKGNQQSFLSVLPQFEANAILESDTSLNDPLLLLKAPSDRIAALHYTWLKSALEGFSEEVRPLLVSPLSKRQADQLTKALNIAPLDRPLTPQIKNYLNRILLSKVKGSDTVTPLEFLPQGQLSFLADCSSGDIVELCDFLGLYDIGEELRHIVDKKILKNVYQCLSPKEQSFLKQCMSTKIKLVAPGLGLDRWNGEPAKLRHAMQARGLLRLGKALSGAHEDLLWHLTHRLDKGRGETLFRYYSKQPISGVTPLLIQQVQNVMNILKKKSES